jgi:hypothetical protein
MPTRSISARPLGAIPLEEVSGLARGRDASGRDAILAIGDRAGTVAWAPLEDDLDALAWQTLDLRHAEGTRIPERDPQLEAVAVDGRMTVVMVQESPIRAEAIDAPGRRVRAHITFVVPDVPALGQIHESWLDPDGSRAEGVVLMREGHILLVKEKGPSALLEFGPAGSHPLGLDPEAWLPHDAAWEVADGDVELTCLAAWRPGDQLDEQCPDFSDAAVDGTGRLLLTGDQAGALVAVGAHRPAEDPFAGRFEAEGIWLVKGIEEKPEGVVVLPHGDVLIACDRRKVKRNLFLVAGADLR